jgi:hypothetical protein
MPLTELEEINSPAPPDHFRIYPRRLRITRPREGRVHQVMTDRVPLSPAQRRLVAVAVAVALTAGTRLAPAAYERRLLAEFEQGELTLAQLDDLLDRRVY